MRLPSGGEMSIVCGQRTKTRLLLINLFYLL